MNMKRIPLAGASFHADVSICMFCSVAGPVAALGEIGHVPHPSCKLSMPREERINRATRRRLRIAGFGVVTADRPGGTSFASSQPGSEPCAAGTCQDLVAAPAADHGADNNLSTRPRARKA